LDLCADAGESEAITRATITAAALTNRFIAGPPATERPAFESDYPPIAMSSTTPTPVEPRSYRRQQERPQARCAHPMARVALTNLLRRAARLPARASRDAA